MNNKDMNYEQKYKEALARAKEQLDGAKVFDYDNEQIAHDIRATVYNIFPELKENKKEWIEKIRQELKSYLGHRKTEQISESDAVHQWIAWLEKQDEPKDYGSIDPHFSKPINNKVEPKFKDGDWIVWENQCYKVNYNGCGYELVLLNGLSTSLEYGTIDESAHLWNIEDAKDGDVLVASDGSIFIYKNQRDNGVVHYVAVTSYNDLVINENDYSWERKDVCHPATKDEQTILFERIKEAGYKWNAETKELKKIEQTTEIPFGAKDSELQEAIYYIPDGYHAEINGNEVVIKKGKQKSL